MLSVMLVQIKFWRSRRSAAGRIRWMRRRRVESTTVRSVGYERRSRTMEIEFQSGTVYQYVDVPARVYEEFWRAESKGKYFNCEIRDLYAFVRRHRGRAAGG